MKQTFKNTGSTTATTSTVDEQKVWLILENLMDPEIPVLSIVDLGIVRDVKVVDGSSADKTIKISITPTYSGCPAMDMIALNIRMALLENGMHDSEINTVISPAWTTDWMTEKGKERLKAYGISPPIGKSLHQQYLEDLQVECPQCGSKNTRLISAFSSTSCKALFQCNVCKEPFDYFKCH
jgi:ring-1,2-phenylacetyl-CoA epoxidase subunit PaaD